MSKKASQKKSEKSDSTRAREADIGDVDPSYKAHLKEPFLKYYRERRAIGMAAEQAGVTQRTVRRWRDSDRDFREKFEEIDGLITDELRSSTLERAINGVAQPGPGGKLRLEYSDTLAALHLKQRDPSFRERVQVEIVQKEISRAIAELVEIIRKEAPPAIADRIAKQLKKHIELEVAA
jgi:hypothetical protein